jgi:hypothetical protein
MLFMRKALVLIKIETTYATDPTPAGADAMLVKNLRLTPMNAEFAKRDVVRAFLGNDESLPAGVHVMVEFEVEAQGSGTGGTAPKWGRVMRACGLSETLTAADVTGTATAGTARTITLAAGASAVDGFYNGMQLSITAGANVGFENLVASYVGSTKVATLVKSAAGAYGATSAYAIRANAAYKPISSAFESVTFVCNYDGVQHKALGARGSVSLGLNAKGIPTFKFRLLGLYQTVADVALTTPDYSAFKVPVVANSANTPAVYLHDVAPITQSIDLDLANSAVFRALIGGESIQVLDRSPTGKMVFEATSVAFKDWWTVAKNATLDAFGLIHGTVAGFRVGVTAPNVQVKPPTYSDDQNVLMANVDLELIPGQLAGNDELVIMAA